jgi:hypothetical protein
VVPEGVIFTVGNTRVEADLGKFHPCAFETAEANAMGSKLGYV